MTVTIGRRELLAALGSAAAAWPLAARGHQGPCRSSGRLAFQPRNARCPMAGFRRGLSETGFVEGRNVAISLGRRSV